MSPSTEQPPDVLGETRRVELVANMLLTIQRQRFELHLEQVANDHADDAPSAVGAKTIAERRVDLDASEARVLKEFADLMPAVHRLTAAQAPT